MKGKNAFDIKFKPCKDYNKSVAEKEVDVAYSRIMLLGSAGVGKTSFTRSLMQKKFKKEMDSTVISKISSVKSFHDIPAEPDLVDATRQDEHVTKDEVNFDTVMPDSRPDNPNESESRTRRFISVLPVQTTTPDDTKHNKVGEGDSEQSEECIKPDETNDYRSHSAPQASSDRSVQYEQHMISDAKWKIVSEDDEIDEVAHLLALVFNKNDSASQNLRNKTVAAMSLYKAESPLNRSELLDREIRKNEVHLFFSKAMERAKKLTQEQIQDIKPQPFLHVWDCGGQAVFLEILPAFLTSRTMFFLLFNAAQSLKNKWKNFRSTKGNIEGEEMASMSTKELLLSWMENIHHHLAQLDENEAFYSYPIIYCIGTHGDELEIDEQQAIIKEMENEYLHKKKALAHLVKDTLIVDNTTAGSNTEDPNFSLVRNEVRDFTCNNLIVKTPVSWVLFRKVIKMLDKKVISLKEAHEIGLACKIPHNDVPKVLLFYHDLGVILYYQSIKGLQDKVVIDPQWFVDSLGKVFTLEGREVKDHSTRSNWEMLRSDGILVKQLYQKVWKDIEEIMPDNMMELLVHFCLAAEIKTERYHIPNTKKFFLPAVLKSFDLSSQPTPSILSLVPRAANLHITFSTDFVSPGFFTRLITSFAKNEKCKICFEDGVYRNRITFKFGIPDINQVTFTDCCNTIQVSVERYCDAPTVTSFNDACKELKTIIDTCATEVEKSLANNSLNLIKISRQFRFECTAPMCSKYEAHYILPALGQSADLPLCCQKSKSHRRLTREESYWFPGGEQTAQNVMLTSSIINIFIYF